MSFGEAADELALTRFFSLAGLFYVVAQGIRALEMGKLSASLSRFDLGLMYASKARVVLALTHGPGAAIVRTIDEFVSTLRAMVAKTAQATAYKAAMANATDALGSGSKQRK